MLEAVAKIAALTMPRHWSGLSIRACDVTLDARNEALDAGDASARPPGVAPDGHNAYRVAIGKTPGTRYVI